MTTPFIPILYIKKDKRASNHPLFLYYMIDTPWHHIKFIAIEMTSFTILNCVIYSFSMKLAYKHRFF